MADNLNFLKREDDLNSSKMEYDINYLKMKEDLNNFFNGRQHHLKEMKDDLIFFVLWKTTSFIIN